VRWLSDAPRSPDAVEQAARLAGPNATVAALHVLAGGTHARTTLIRTANPESEVVLREYPPGDDTVKREARVLRALDGLDGLAPRLLASDSEDLASRGSWVLISRLPGTADITPREPAARAEQLGRTLARVHQTPRHRVADLPSILEPSDGSPAGLSGPAADIVTANWETLASTPVGLTHYDFWSGNVVWEDEVLTGVVDWTGGSLGPPGFDIGWCRLDLYLLHGERIADRFLDAYEKASGSALPHPVLWDLWAVARSHEMVETWEPNYHDLGRTDLTATELRNRHTSWTEHSLAKIAASI
jgi:aminoglycoside phosphotransferase (APT) family kinase protein